MTVTISSPSHFVLIAIFVPSFKLIVSIEIQEKGAKWRIWLDLFQAVTLGASRAKHHRKLA